MSRKKRIIGEFSAFHDDEDLVRYKIGKIRSKMSLDIHDKI